MGCHFCYNAHVWAKEPHEEEDYFDEGLDDDNDGSSCSIGHSSDKYQMYFNSGMGVACNVEVCKWYEGSGWHPIVRYYPKFCPECGRKLDEYMIGKRGESFTKKVE
jgi:hypothetical protein